MDEMFTAIGEEIDILIGQNNPFGKNCGLVATKLPGQGLLAIIGPTRMDYSESVELVKIIKALI
jgi:transcriptional regulator of heat shock response